MLGAVTCESFFFIMKNYAKNYKTVESSKSIRIYSVFDHTQGLASRFGDPFGGPLGGPKRHEKHPEALLKGL